MNQRLSNGEHYRLRDGREFRLCAQVDSQGVGSVLVDGGLVTVSIGENELRGCPIIPYLERSFSYDSRNKVGMIWRTMRRIGDGFRSAPSPSRRPLPK